jgi:hypothetical protein
MSTKPTATPFTDQVLAGTVLHVTFSSGVEAEISVRPSQIYEDEEQITAYYLTGSAAGVCEPICDVDETYLDTHFLVDAVVHEPQSDAQ